MTSIINYSDPANRIKHVFQHSGLPSWPRLAQLLKLNRTENLYQIKRGSHGISKNLAERIRKHYPEYNINWLLSGEGTPFIKPEPRTIPIYNRVEDVGDFAPADFMTLPPLMPDHIEFAIVVNNRNLLPKIKPGSCIFLAAECDYIRRKQLYLIVMKNHEKYLRYCYDCTDTKLVLKDAHDCSLLTIRKDGIRDAYRAVGLLSLV